MKIDFVKTLEASSPYIPGRIYFEESTSLIKVATANNQYRVFGGVRSAEYDSSTDILTIQNGNGDEIYIDFSQYVKQDEYEDDQYVISTSLNDLNTRVSDIEDELDNTTDLWEPGTGTGSMVSASSGGSANGIYSTVEGYLSETGGTYETNTISAGTVDQSAGSYAHAEGRATISNGGIGSHSEGNKTLASGKASHAEGNNTEASGAYSHAEGNATTARGGSSHAEGSDTIASGGSSHAEGGNTTASGNASHAEGSGTNANASHSHAEGSDTTASGNGSHAEGQGTIASGNGSHAEGVGYNDIYTTAGADSAHAEGAGVVVKGQAAHGEGLLNVAGRTQEEAVAALADFHNLSGTTEQKVSKLIGFASHSEGSSTRALGTSSHAEGNSTQALVNATHAEGDSTTASGEAAHSEGYNTTASGNQAHAEGYHTEATANQAHAEGKYTEATSENAHAEGNHTTANGNASHTEGYYTVANNNVEHAEGQYNVSNKASTTFGNAGNTIHSVGIGTSNARKNAFEIMQNGDAYLLGIGGYNGKNYSSASTLQSVLSNIPSAVTDSTVSGWGYIKSYTETDPIFSASPAAGITASDITGWNNKVSNVQADWNATTGLSAILNKPTIPSTLDQIADGSTRKLSDYLPLAGGTLNTGCGIEAHNSNNTSTFTPSYFTITNLVKNEYSEYGCGYILWDASNGDEYTLSFPTNNGKIALDSDIPTDASIGAMGYTKNAGTLTGVKFNNVSATINGTVAEITATIPAAVTESTVSGWGFTKNAAPGTLTTTSATGLSAATNEALSGSISLHKVSKTGSYNDLLDKPSIPAAQVQSDWNATSGMGVILNKPTIPSAPGTLNTNNTTAQTASTSESLSSTINLHKVAKTGTYSDLIGKPTIPAAQVQSDWNATSGMGVILNKPSIPAAANNATITIQKGGTNVDSFTVDASTNKTINIPNELPTVTSTDNGKILKVVNGAWAAVTPVTVYSGSNEPSSSQGIDGDIYIQS